MMIGCRIDVDGKIINMLVYERQSDMPIGWVVLPEDYKLSKYTRYQGGKWVEIGADEIDETSLQRALDYAKRRKIDELKGVRQSKIHEPLNGFDVRNKDDLENIEGAVRLFEHLQAQGVIVWTMADDSDRAVTKAELENVITQYAIRKAQIFSVYQGYKNTVMSSSSVDAVKSIVWE